MTREEFFELVEDSDFVSMSNWRWGWSEDRHVEIDGEHFIFHVRYHHSDGLQHYDGQAVKFYPAERRETTSWVRAE